MSMQCDASDVCVVSFSCSKQHVLKWYIQKADLY
jgi:hypothetical protein